MAIVEDEARGELVLIRSPEIDDGPIGRQAGLHLRERRSAARGARTSVREGSEEGREGVGPRRAITGRRGLAGRRRERGEGCPIQGDGGDGGAGNADVDHAIREFLADFIELIDEDETAFFITDDAWRSSVLFHQFCTNLLHSGQHHGEISEQFRQL